jgi:hypothetical protein
MSILQIDRDNFSSVALNPMIAQSGKTGYSDVSINDFIEPTEQALLHQIVGLFADESDIDWDKIATIQQLNGTVKGIFGGSIWATKEGEAVLGFGANNIEVKIEKGQLIAGKAKIEVSSSVIDIDGKKVEVPFLFVNEVLVDDFQDDDYEPFKFTTPFFFDNEKIKPGATLKLIKKALKENDISLIVDALKVKSTGMGFASPLLNLVRVLLLMGVEVPQGGIEFQVASFGVQEPSPDYPNSGYSLVINLKEPVPYPCFYMDKKTKQAVQLKSSPTAIAVPKSKAINSALVDQANGCIKDSAVAKMYQDAIKDPEKGLVLRITNLDPTKPDEWHPDVNLLFGRADQTNGLKIAGMFQGKQPQQLAPATTEEDDDALDADFNDIPF